MTTKRYYDKASVMRHAARLMREDGLSRSNAMKAAWAAAKGGALAPIYPKAQEAGFRAAARRYGLDRAARNLAALAAPAAQWLAERAAEAIQRIGRGAPVSLPHYGATIDLDASEWTRQ